MGSAAGVGGARTAFGHDPLGTLSGLGGLLACYLGLCTTLFARLFVSHDTESTRRRAFLLVLLAVCGVTFVMAATSEIVWLAIHGGDLNYGNVMFNLWMTSFMVAGAIWSSRMFVQVDAGRWGGEEAAAAASRAQRVVTMNPVAGARTTEPMGHMEHLVSTAQKGKGDM